jgi:hypothetical protein
MGDIVSSPDDKAQQAQNSLTLSYVNVLVKAPWEEILDKGVGNLENSHLNTGHITSIDLPNGYIHARAESPVETYIKAELAALIRNPEKNRLKIEWLNEFLKFAARFEIHKPDMIPELIELTGAFITHILEKDNCSGKYFEKSYRALKSDILDLFLSQSPDLDPNLYTNQNFRTRFLQRDLFDCLFGGFVLNDIPSWKQIYRSVKIWASTDIHREKYFPATSLPDTSSTPFFTRLSVQVRPELRQYFDTIDSSRSQSEHTQNINTLKGQLLEAFISANRPVIITDFDRSRFRNFEKLFSRQWPQDNTGLSPSEVVDKLFVEWVLGRVIV